MPKMLNQMEDYNMFKKKNCGSRPQSKSMLKETPLVHFEDVY